MKKKVTNFFMFSVVALSFLGCNSELLEENEKLPTKKTSLEEVSRLGSRSFDLRSARGTVTSSSTMQQILRSFGFSEQAINTLFREKPKEKIQFDPSQHRTESEEVTTLAKLEEVGITYDDIMNILTRRTSPTIFSNGRNVKPDGFLISGVKFGSVNNGLLNYYGRNELKLVTNVDAKVVNDFQTKYTNLVIRQIINDSHREESGVLRYEYTKEESANYSQTHSGGVTTGFGLKKSLQLGVFSGEATYSLSFTYNYSSTSGNAKLERTSIVSQADYKLPARSVQYIAFVFPEKKGKVKYGLPVYFTGSIAANYPVKVDGHYFHNFDFTTWVVQPKYGWGKTVFRPEIEVEYKDAGAPDILFSRPQPL